MRPESVTALVLEQLTEVCQRIAITAGNATGPMSSTLVRTILAGALLLGALVLSMRAHYLEIEQGLLHDFATFQGSGKLFADGRSPYLPQNRWAFELQEDRRDFVIHRLSPENEAKLYQPRYVKLNLNPPPFVMATLPLGFMSFRTAHLLWSILSLLALGASVVLLTQTLPRPAPEAGLWIGLGTVAFLPSWFNLQFGQVAFFTLLFLVVAYRLGLAAKYERMGALLGVAAGFKLFFGVFLLMLVAKRQWPAVAAFCGAFFITMLFPLSVMSIADYKVFVQAPSVLPMWLETRYASGWNGALTTALYRLPDLSIDLARTLGYVASGLLLAGYLKVLSDHHEDRSTERFDHEFGVTVMLALLLSPLGWKYYGLFGLFIILRMYRHLGALPRPQWALGMLAVALICVGWPGEVFSTGPVSLASRMGAQLTMLGFFALGALAYLVPPSAEPDETLPPRAQLTFAGVVAVGLAIPWLSYLDYV